ncbi:MAG: sigma-70 family RNA polymerase sigma factor [Candidatus Gastranaerophilales bacterium]|nr:sigma-70 family RNA polymerase sigma factor [Candidatus Gastranaerophilales bacterium]
MKGLAKKRYKEMNQLDLIILAQNDDYDAIEELIKREQKNVYASFCYLGANKESLSDLTQEVLFRMSKNIKNLKNPKLFKSWLGQIITNLFYDELRKKQKFPDSISIDSYWANDEKDENTILHICDDKLKPDERTIGKETSEIIQEMICRLPEHFRIVIILRELQGLSYEEIAKITQTNVGTVKSRISRARNKLQECLKPYFT